VVQLLVAQDVERVSCRILRQKNTCTYNIT
jgi:hypothetical protein